jgi:hypothetical protein
MKFILNELFTLNEEGETPEEPGDKSKASETDTAQNTNPKDIDWELLYKNCKTKEDYARFWNGGQVGFEGPTYQGYYKGVWGKHAVAVKGLGAAFQETLIQLGWSAAENPFITFITNLLAKNTLGTGILPSAETMKAICSAYSEHKLKAKDLVGNGELKDKNIIFAKGFYAENASTQETLLKYQFEFIQNCPANFSDKGVAFANIYSTSIATPTDTLDNTTLDLAKPIRDPKKIKVLVTKAIGKDLEERNAATDQTIKAIVEKANKPDSAKIVLTYIMMVFDAFQPELIKAAKSKLGTKLQTAAIAPAQGAEAKKLLNLDNTKYTKDQIITLISELNKIATGA